MSEHDAVQATLREIAAEQERLTLPRFSNEDAWTLGVWVVERARERDLAVVVDIRRGDQQLFHAALAGTNADNDSWIERKVRSVRRFSMASLRLGQLYARHVGDFTEATRLPYDQYVAAGGCIPITITDVGMVGTLAVSGLTDQADHDLAAEALVHLKSALG